MSTINYAIEVDTGAAVYNDDYAMGETGIFRFISGRPGYDGTPTYPTGETGISTDTLQAKWYEGWITADGMSSPSRRVDPSKTGEYGTLSGFNFTIVNSKGTDQFWKFLQDNDVYLTNREVTFYVVIDNVFYHGWNGVITNNPMDEENYMFQCGDKFRTIHKQIPPTVINPTNFPDATEAGQGEPTPISIGNVSYSLLTQVNPEIEWQTLYTLDGVDYDITNAEVYTITGPSKGSDVLELVIPGA